jgi:hypothetical protein
MSWAACVRWWSRTVRVWAAESGTKFTSLLKPYYKNSNGFQTNRQVSPEKYLCFSYRFTFAVWAALTTMKNHITDSERKLALHIT